MAQLFAPYERERGASLRADLEQVPCQTLLRCPDVVKGSVRALLPAKGTGGQEILGMDVAKRCKGTNNNITKGRMQREWSPAPYYNNNVDNNNDTSEAT